MDRVILCMKWGTLYEPEYVNVLFNAARANITGDFRFVCLTDNTAGFVDGVEAYPIPDIGLRSQDYHHGAWPKLTVFSKNLYGLKGRALFIDLDTVICGNLDQMFDYIGGLTALDSRPWRYKSGPARTGTGVFGFEIGSMDYVVEKIKENRDISIETYGLEQDFLHGEALEIKYWPDEWIRSFKYHQRAPLLLDRLIGPKPPAKDAKILCFHGKPRPIDLIRTGKVNWDRFPHYGKNAVPWMVDYWTRYGGTL
jgi:hypothetical protein